MNTTDTQHDDAILQAAIDEACSSHAHEFYMNSVALNPSNTLWPKERAARLALARALLARLPEPTPPTADGKTPGQVAFEATAPCGRSWAGSVLKIQAEWEKLASAVLAPFGQASLEAGIKRMEAVPNDDLYFDYSSANGGVADGINAVRARLITAAREGQPSSQPAEIPWIEWKGGPCPLKDEEVKEWQFEMRDNGFNLSPAMKPSAYRWDHNFDGRGISNGDIIAYRVTKWREGQPAAVDGQARAEKAEARIVWLEAQNERQANDMQDVAHRLGVFADDVGTGSVKNAASFKSSEIHRLNAALQKAEAELADSANALTYISETLDAMGIPSVTAAGDGPGSIGIEQRMDLALRELEAKALSQLLPLSEAVPVPEGCVRIRAWAHEGTFRVSTLEDPGDTHFVDVRLPAPAVDTYAELKEAHVAGKVIQYNCGSGDKPEWEDVTDPEFSDGVATYRIKPESIFEAHGQTWTKHDGGPMPCDGRRMVCIHRNEGEALDNVAAMGDNWAWDDKTIIGWRYADKTKAEPVLVQLDYTDIRATDEFRHVDGGTIYTPSFWDNRCVKLGDERRGWMTLATSFERRQLNSTEWKPCTKPQP